MDNRALLGLAILVGIGVVVFIWEQIKGKKNDQLATTGEDKERLKSAVALVLPDETGYEVAYGHWEKVEYYGRSRRTTYYTYALAFNAEKMWMIPLGYEKDKILPGRPVLITKDSLGKADVTPHEKNGELIGVSLVLRDKDGKSPVNLDVDVKNRRSDSYHHVNIDQPEECDAFRRFITGMSDVVAQENAGLDARMKDEADKQAAKGARTLGILGLVTCWTGILGLIFGGIGLLTAPKPKDTGGKAGAPFILCLVATIISALFMAAGAFVIFVL